MESETAFSFAVPDLAYLNSTESATPQAPHELWPMERRRKSQCWKLGNAATHLLIKCRSGHHSPPPWNHRGAGSSGWWLPLPKKSKNIRFLPVRNNKYNSLQRSIVYPPFFGNILSLKLEYGSGSRLFFTMTDFHWFFITTAAFFNRKGLEKIVWYSHFV